jgi:hypothetical protein
MESRITAAKARANRANNVLLGSAAALFVAALVAARVAHPARASHTPATSSTASSSTSSDGYYDDSGGDGYYDGYYGSGSTAPSQSAQPQLSTGGS